jgi:hypothetical protein
MSKFSYLTGNHDLSLPDWGPYSKRFFGISHLAAPRHGARFDFTVIPGIYRRQSGVPDALRPSGYIPWSIDENLENYSYRQQLEWRDLQYCDISFSRLDDHCRLVRMELVNNTDLDADFAIHLLSSLELQPPETVLLRNGIWLAAIDNSELETVESLPTDGLNYDGMRRREEYAPGSVRGHAIGNGFGYRKGDRIVFDLPGDADGDCYLRYRASRSLEILVNGTPVKLNTASGWTLIKLGAFEKRLEIVSGGHAKLTIDGIAICPELPDFAPVNISPRPVHEQPAGDRLIIQYPGIDHCYGVRWSEDRGFIRRYSVPDIVKTFHYDDSVHQPFLSLPDHNAADNFLDVVLQPLAVAAHSTRITYAVVCDGPADRVGQYLDNLPEDPEAVYRQAQSRYYNTPSFGQNRMAAVTMTNVVYPTYFYGKYVRHHSPGRRWNCLYTWDSGFIGLGLLEISVKRAIENLNAYLTECGDRENAFVHHGSPVPVQFYLYLELWNRTHDREMLAFFYPRLKQYYDFLSGRNPLSWTRRRSNTGMICTWDYFYNSGGWDDYPPQWAVHQTDAKNILPVVSTAMTIRCAEILQNAARELGYPDNYRPDIELFASALQEHSWDRECGYFSYVIHDADGNPTGFYRCESGENYNMGLDGATPLIAGITTPEQSEILWNKLSSPGHCWTQAGISTVDRSAPYYRTDGYWNGAVWMPHQWFFWKAALNDGRGDFAWRIAEKALELWERETQASHACYEQFSVSSGRGSGWHHFSGLSTPVLSWYNAYYGAERLTTGYDVWQKSCGFTASGVAAELEINGAAGITTVLATLPEGDYAAEYQGRAVPLRRRGNAIEVELPKNTAGTLRIHRQP